MPRNTCGSLGNTIRATICCIFFNSVYNTQWLELERGKQPTNNIHGVLNFPHIIWAQVVFEQYVWFSIKGAELSFVLLVHSRLTRQV